jgi:hypothetical protein
MTTASPPQPKLCAACGYGHPRRTARPGRFEQYKGFSIELPADHPLLECDACGEILMTPKDMAELEPFIEAGYRTRLRQAAVRAVDTLAHREGTVAAVERKLYLSNGYLSRVRHGSVEPGYHLVALLVLLADAPASTLAGLDDVVAAG